MRKIFMRQEWSNLHQNDIKIGIHGTVFGNGIFTNYSSLALIMNAKSAQIQVSIKIYTTG